MNFGNIYILPYVFSIMSIHYPKIVVEPPGPRALKIISEDSKFLMQSFIRWYPLVIEKGYGAVVVDVDGNEYIDLNAGIAVCSIGHCHPRLVEAIEKQARKFQHYSITDFLYEPAVTLAKEIIKITPGNYSKKVFYSNSGAEAIEASMKIARGYFKGLRPYIISYIGSFHGRTFGALSLTSSKPIQRKWFYPFVPCIEHIPYPYCYRCPWRQEYPSCNYYCIDFIDEYYLQKYIPPDEVCAIVAEPIQGEGGYIVPPPDYWIKIKRLCEKYGILLIDDEVQAGMGRTGKWFSIEHWNISPDIIAIAKGVAGGLPLGVTVGREEIMSLPKGAHASTFGGNPISCAAALAVIDVIRDERLLENSSRLGEKTIKRLNELMDKYEIIGDVRGKGLMIGVELVKNKRSKEPAVKEMEEVVLKCFKKGVVVIGAGKSTIRIAPPLIITEELLMKAIDIIEEALREVVNR